MFLTNCTNAKYELFEIELIIYIKMDLALNNLQRLICHKTKSNKYFQTKRKKNTQTFTYLYLSPAPHTHEYLTNNILPTLY